jgi:hypothetical protein
MVELEHLSYSSISTYQLCAKSWWWRYVSKPDVATSTSLLFGSAFHSAVESLIETHGTPRAPIRVRDLWMDTWELAVAKAEHDGRVAWNGATSETLARDGLTMLTSPDAERFFAEFKPLVEGEKPVIEKRIDLAIPGLPLRVIGYIDAIDTSGIPCDFKTAARSWTQQKADEETQPIFYLAALNQAGFPLNRGMLFRHVVFTKPTKAGKVSVQTFTTTKSIGDLFRLFTTILDVWKGIQAGSFPCNTQSWKCGPRWCEFHSLCQGKQP